MRRWEAETEDSPEASKLARLAHTVTNDKTLLPVRWKARTDTSGCPLTSTCVPWHVGPLLYVSHDVKIKTTVRADIDRGDRKSSERKQRLCEWEPPPAV